ncbi:MAG: DUF1127 domain-containing protein [Pseudomonadota bacterium]
MAFIDGIHRFETSMVARMRASFAEARRQYMQHQAFRRTYDELNRLSEHELDDLDLARGDIRDVAWNATHAN